MDAAFPTAAYPSMTNKELEAAYQKYNAIPGYGATADKMQAELDRRYAVSTGDVSVMTPGERLRFNATGKAR